jgi:glycosidase
MPLTSGNSYKEKATEIINKVKSGKYSHVIILPISYNWYPGSLGYQPQGFFSPSWFYGNPDELREMVDTLHGAGISVILDMCWWQTTESNGPDSLMNYDGTDLYAGKEDATRFGGFYMNLNSPYVLEFIKSSFNFWLDEYMFDGLRLDGVNEIVFDKTNERNLLTEKIKLINYLIEGIEDKVLLEFIDKKSPMKFGFATDKDDGSILALLLKAQLELTATDSQPHKDDIIFQEIKQYLFESKSFSSINHDFFITGLSKSKVETFDDFSNIAKSYNVIPFNEDYSKNISFILKILYALRDVIIEFAHIEHYSQSLSDEYEEFKNYVDDVWVDDFVLTETDNGFRVAYDDKEIDFNFATREVTPL